MIAFPFILCFISSPFVIGGIIFYMWRDKRRSDKLGELIQRRTEASLWCRKRFDAYFKQHGVPMPDWQFEDLEEEAKKKFGLEKLRAFE